MRTFEIIPAFDLWAGGLARMRGDDAGSVEELPGDPFELAGRLIEGGATRLHVADLDAAIRGVPANLDLVARLAQLPVRIQAGGSLSPEAAEEALDRGADRAVLGAGVLSDPDALTGAVARHGERIGVAIDIRDGRVTPRGTTRVGPSLDDALDLVAEARPSFATFTDAGWRGSLSVQDLEALGSVVTRAGVPVIASGGIRSLDDLRSLAEVQPPPAGAIVGRAFQEDAFTYPEAVAAVSVR
jgi:phosphoribosylformimino-5-aminoimidazole carboxamide ribonucleotide (ProFAR) isomerase